MSAFWPDALVGVLGLYLAITGIRSIRKHRERPADTRPTPSQDKE